MKKVYLNEKKRLTKRRIKKIAKRVYKLSKKEEIVVIPSKKLSQSQELCEALAYYKINVLNRKMDHKIYDM